MSFFKLYLRYNILDKYLATDAVKSKLKKKKTIKNIRFIKILLTTRIVSYQISVGFFSCIHVYFYSATTDDRNFNSKLFSRSNTGTRERTVHVTREKIR